MRKDKEHENGHLWIESSVELTHRRRRMVKFFQSTKPICRQTLIYQNKRLIT